MVRKLLAEIMLRRTKGSKDVNGEQIVKLPPKTQVRTHAVRVHAVRTHAVLSDFMM